MTTSRELLVVKFGGSVLDGGPAFRKAAEAVKRECNRGRDVVVVASALKGVTDRLLSAAEEITPNTEPNVIDHIISLGEEQSVRLMAAALRSVGVDAVEVTPNSPSWPIVTDEAFGNAEPIMEECVSSAELGLRPLLRRGKVPVVCGFVGRSPSGRITTLGRGGSDTTAVVLARCLGADELVLVKDVEGVYTADPHRVEDVRPLKALKAREAHILALAGAKFIHSKVFKYKPDDLRVRIVSSSRSLDRGGTVITGAIPCLKVETHERPVMELTIVGDALSDPEALARISQEIKEKGGRVLSMSAVSPATELYLDGDPASLLEGVHTLLESTADLKALSASENHALITVWGSALDGEAAVAKAIARLSKAGIDARIVLVGKSSIYLLSNWERRGEVSRSIEEVLKEV